jgi:hypothetical protein
MAFTSVNNTDKSLALNAAKAEFERDLYKNLTRLGYDPDTYDINSFSFDPDASSEETDPDYNVKKYVALLISRVQMVYAKIADL